jgi:mono/diheme cytochrome c family protein
MKLLSKVMVGLACFAAIGAGAGLAGFSHSYPKVKPAEDLTIESNPNRLARGRYLVENVCGCVGCHSDSVGDQFNYPVKAETRGGGGEVFDQSTGLPGRLVSRNITPYHLKNWTDGEIARALRVGVNQQGQALFPLMPYPRFRNLSQEDLYSIVVYLRTLPPVAKDPEPTKLDFPMNLIVRTLPQDAGAYPASPDPKDHPAYARYMANAAGCADCHTPVDHHGAPLPGMDFAGGMEYHNPDGTTLRSVNITPDRQTGIGEWTKDYFIQRFRKGAAMAERHAMVKPGEFNTVMPWGEYGKMTDEDLGALYDFLHEQVKPVSHSVDKFTAQSKT